MSEAKKTGVLLLGFGGPESLEEVRPFILDVVAGRNVPAERVEAVVEQYRQIGGSSPYNRLTVEQANALQNALAADGCAVPVFLGLIHSKPTVADAFGMILDRELDTVVVIVMAPHRSEASFQKYLNYLESAKTIHKDAANRFPRIELVSPWHTDRLFVSAIVDRVNEVLETLPADLPRERVRLIFTAHSIPQAMSDDSGYARQIEETAAAVVGALDRETGAGWGQRYGVGYQSRSGPPQQPWLEPDVSARLAEARDRGATHAIVVPIGFLVDHVEVLFDLDVLAASAARELGMIMLRTRTVGSNEKFVRLLTNLVRSKIESVYA